MMYVPVNRRAFLPHVSFFVDTSHNARVRIASIDSDFRRWFIDGDCDIVTQEDQELFRIKLRHERLKIASTYLSILEKFGGEENVAISPWMIYNLMAEQDSGQEGVLLTNSQANIFFSHDFQGVLRVVRVFESFAWNLKACPVDDPNPVVHGCKVFVPY